MGKKTICEICGFEVLQCETVIHVRNPTLNRGSVHIYVLKDTFLVSNGAPYRQELYPLLNVSIGVKIKAQLDYIAHQKEIEIFFRQPQEFQDRVIHNFVGDENWQQK